MLVFTLAITTTGLTSNELSLEEMDNFIGGTECMCSSLFLANYYPYPDCGTSVTWWCKMIPGTPDGKTCTFRSFMVNYYEPDEETETCKLYFQGGWHVYVCAE